MDALRELEASIAYMGEEVFRLYGITSVPVRVGVPGAGRFGE